MIQVMSELGENDLFTFPVEGSLTLFQPVTLITEQGIKQSINWSPLTEIATQLQNITWKRVLSSVA